jgi:subtilisin family serine protease
LPPNLILLTQLGATFLVDLSGENNLTDGYGHGTHTAGTIGSKTYGVAKNTKLYAVKVLDQYGGGTTAGIISGFNWLVQNRTQDCPKGSVVNLSLGGPRRQSMNDAVSTSLSHLQPV